MNQILDTGDNGKNSKKKNKVKNKINIRSTGEKADIKTVVKFFTITLILFGIFMIGSGTYGWYKNGKTNEEIENAKPTILLENKDERNILLRITHQFAINTVSYSWSNEQESTIIQGNGRKYIEEVINIPAGTNTLNIKVVDEKGKETTFSKEYTVELITINLEVVNNSDIKIKLESENNISFFTYRWDEEEETRIDVNNVTAEQSIAIPKGLHILTITAVDENNNTVTKEQKVMGKTKPTVEVTTDGQDFIVRASDEEGLTKVEVILNETDRTRLVTQEKTLEYRFPLKDGENKIEVTAYNTNDVTETFRARYTK